MRSRWWLGACLVAVLLAAPGVTAHASRTQVSLSFINSPLVPRDVLLPIFSDAARRRAATTMAAPGIDAAEVVGFVVTLPLRLLARVGCAVGAVVPDRLPHWWSVPEAGAHGLGALAIMASNIFYLKYAIRLIRRKRPLLGACLLVAMGASLAYHGAQIFMGAAACLTHKACYVDTSIALTSGLVYLRKCGLPCPRLSLAAAGLFALGPSCGPLYDLSHSAWHFMSAYTAFKMATGERSPTTTGADAEAPAAKPPLALPTPLPFLPSAERAAVPLPFVGADVSRAANSAKPAPSLRWRMAHRHMRVRLARAKRAARTARAPVRASAAHVAHRRQSSGAAEGASASWWARALSHCAGAVSELASAVVGSTRRAAAALGAAAAAGFALGQLGGQGGRSLPASSREQHAATSPFGSLWSTLARGVVDALESLGSHARTVSRGLLDATAGTHTRLVHLLMLWTSRHAGGGGVARKGAC